MVSSTRSPNPTLGRRPGGGPQPVRPPSRETALPELAVARLRNGDAPLRPSDVLDLQRTLGNAATTTAIQRLRPGVGGSPLPVQRFQEEDLDDYKEGGAMLVESSATFAEAGKLPYDHKLGSWYDSGQHGDKPEDPNKLSNAETGTAFGAISELISLGGLGLAARNRYKAGKEVKEHREKGLIGAARKASRERSEGNGDLTTSSLGVASSAGQIASGAYEIKASLLDKASTALPVAEHTAHVAGAVAHGVALPLSFFNMSRWARKTEFARQRWDRLEKLRDEWDGNPKKQLKVVSKAHRHAVEAQAEGERAVQHAEAKQQRKHLELEDKKRRLQQKKGSLARTVDRAKGPTAQVRMAMSRLDDQIAQIDHEKGEWTRALNQAQAQLITCNNEVARTLVPLQEQQQIQQAAKQKAEDLKAKVSKEWVTGKEGVADTDEIMAYALRKNRRGFFKKLTTTLGAATGTAAGIAALVVAGLVAAGAGGALMATPVGWSLAGAAAVVTVGMLAYKVGRLIHKRYKTFEAERENAGKKASFWKTLGKAFNPTKKAESKREAYAKRLFDLARGDSGQDETQKARQLIGRLTEKGGGVMSLRSAHNGPLFTDEYWDKWAHNGFGGHADSERKGVIDLLYDKMGS
ncbi:MAG: hypothetical protein KGQ66_00030 [Acidobacteriota bacterium]|nr:hypothetical protein [Acidobacteriota bacterium]